MCFSEEVSLLTLILGLGGSAATFTLGKTFDKIIAVFLGYVSLMQGVEWLLWRHQTCDDYHKTISNVGMILNLLQPIVLGFVLLLFSKRAYENRLYIFIVMFFLFLLDTIFVQHYKKHLQCTTPRSNDPHLVWNWTILKDYNQHWLGYISFFSIISILGMPTLFMGICFALFAMLTMVISILVYPRQDMGAMWCFFTAFVPIIYFILRKINLIRF
jgi:hypothetical protein